MNYSFKKIAVYHPNVNNPFKLTMKSTTSYGENCVKTLQNKFDEKHRRIDIIWRCKTSIGKDLTLFALKKNEFCPALYT